MKQLFLKYMDIKPHELNRSLLALLYVFILITTLLIVKPTITSLFLSELTSEALPLAYVLTAGFAVVFSIFYERVLNAFSLQKIIPGTLILCAGLLVIFSVLLKLEPAFRYWLYIPYLFVAIYGLLTTSQFWILANLIFNAREAKRLFGFIGSGAIAGGIFGGYLTSILTRFMASEDLLIVAAAMLVVCVPISLFLWKKYVHKSKLFPKKEEKIHESPLRLIRKLPLLSLLTLCVAVSVMVAKLVDYQYSHFAAEAITDRDELTSFFGFWFSTLSVVSLLIQLFLTKKILFRLGVGQSLYLLPLGILLGSVLLLIIPELWVVVLIKISDGSFKQSINKAANELLYVPVPLEVKKRSKTFIDVVVDSLATGLAGLVLIFLINGLKVDSVKISYINIALILFWVYLISKTRNAYLSAFKALLTVEHPKVEKHHVKEIDTSSGTFYHTVDRVLREGSEPQILHMLELTLRHPDEHYFEATKKLLDHPSPLVRALAVENLYYLTTEDLSEKMKLMLNDPSDQVVIDAMRYLLHANPNLTREDVKELESLSEHTNIKALTLWAIALTVHTNTDLAQKYELEARVEDLLEKVGDKPETDQERFAVKTLLEAVGHTHLVAHYDFIEQYLEAGDTELVKVALDSAGQVKSNRFVPLIVKCLPSKQLRKDAQRALLACGEGIIPFLYREVVSHEFDFKSAIFVPGVIEQFGTPLAAETLTKLIDDAEYAVSIKVIESLKRLKDSRPELSVNQEYVIRKILDECHVYENILAFLHFQVQQQESGESQEVRDSVVEARHGLIVILEHRLDGQLSRIFKLLGIRYHDQDIDSAIEQIMKGKEEERANAMEYLDNIVDRHIRTNLLPIIDNASDGHGYSEELIRRFKLPEYSEYECFEILLNRHDVKVKHAVLYLIQQIGKSDYVSLVKPLLKDPMPTVSKQAEQVMEHLKN